jgi:hypothetical protein
MTTVRVTVPIRHHCQDRHDYCGQACAQMVIASFVLGPTAKPDTELVPQHDLLVPGRVANDDGWATDPDQLLALFQEAKELTLEQRTWHLGVYSTLEELLTDVCLAVKDGKPSCITLAGQHWIVVTGAILDESGHLVALRTLDPLPVHLPPINHTFADFCTDKRDGEGFVGVMKHVGQLSQDAERPRIPLVANKNTAPLLNKYADKYVGVISGVQPSEHQINTERKALIKETPPGHLPVMPIGPMLPDRPLEPGRPVLDPATLLDELKRKSAEWQIDDVQELLEHSPVLNVRLVKNLDESPDYVVASLFDKSTQTGLLGMFDLTGELLQLRFIGEEGLDSTLGESQDALWWSSQTLSPAHVPFAKQLEESGQEVYSRVLDGYRLNALKMEASQQREPML